MEVKIGVQNVAREITFETDESAEEVLKAVAAAIEGGTALRLTGEKGRQILVPAGVVVLDRMTLAFGKICLQSFSQPGARASTTCQTVTT